MKTYAILTAVLLVLQTAGMPAQSNRNVDALTCPTSDGNILITRTEVILRGYRFTCDSIGTGNVVFLSDQKENVQAKLTRSSNGMEMTVYENDLVMRILAPRDDIQAHQSARTGMSYRAESVRVDLIQYCLSSSTKHPS